MNPIEKLKEIFVLFPGIGKRQAERFVYFLLRQNAAFKKNLSETVVELEKSVRTCQHCQRFFLHSDSQNKLCKICSDPSRDKKLMLIVAHDADFENIERSGSFKGLYFILGGTVPILEKNPEQKVRMQKLNKIIENQKPKEIVIGLSTDPEGENTREYIERELKKLQKTVGFTVTSLGRGLSTGAELEYSDPDTIKSALTNRS